MASIPATRSGGRVLMALLTAVFVVGLIVAGGEVFDGSAGRPRLADASTELADDVGRGAATDETALAPVSLDGSGSEIRMISLGLMAISITSLALTVLFWRHTGRLAEARLAPPLDHSTRGN